MNSDLASSSNAMQVETNKRNVLFLRTIMLPVRFITLKGTHSLPHIGVPYTLPINIFSGPNSQCVGLTMTVQITVDTGSSAQARCS